MRILALLATGFEDLEALGTIALLRRANITVDICAADNNSSIIGNYHIKVEADLKLSDVNIDDYDGLLLPGGQVENLAKEKNVLEIVKTIVSNNKLLACICAAPSIPGELGLLENKKFTCFPGYELLCKNGIHEDKAVVVDENLITAKACGCVYEFTYEIVKKLKGEPDAKKLVESIYFPGNLS